ncbi:hypothetical protein SNE40_000821 [Patella caerulea]|uniref:Uncharacterized protein n=1 Tax=Patella caerulea TaxID=87958 RepID=A0AAN8QHD9_PATCE
MQTANLRSLLCLEKIGKVEAESIIEEREVLGIITMADATEVTGLQPDIWHKWVDEGRITFGVVFNGRQVETPQALTVPQFETSQAKFYDQKCDALFSLQCETTESLEGMLTSVLERVGLQLPSSETMKHQTTSPPVTSATVTPHPLIETPDPVNLLDVAPKNSKSGRPNAQSSVPADDSSSISEALSPPANDICGVTERPAEARTLNPQLRKDVAWIKDAMFDTHLLCNDTRFTQHKLLQSQRHFCRYNCTLQNRGYQNSGGRYSSDRNWSQFPNLYVHPSQHSCRKFARSSGHSQGLVPIFCPTNYLGILLTTTHDQHIQSPPASGNATDGDITIL